MSPGRTPTPRRRRSAIGLCVATVVLGVGFGALLGGSGPSAAGPVCTKSWTAAVSGDWTDGTKWTPAGMPAATDDVCVTVGGTYTVTAQGAVAARSIQVGAATGSATQTLVVRGVGCTTDTTLTVTTTTDVSAHGHLTLSAGGCGTATATYAGTGTLTNAGIVDVLVGTGGARNLRVPIVNTGTVDIEQPTTYDAGTTFDNQGTVDINATLTVNGSSTVVNRTGTIASTGGAQLSMQSSTFEQRAGTTTGPNPVEVRNSTLRLLGTGQPASFVLHQTATLSGATSVGQVIRAEGVGCQYDTTVTVSGAFTNAGTFDATAAGCGAATTIVGGTSLFTNTGLLSVDQGTGGGRYLRLPIRNAAAGTVKIDQPTTFDQGGTPFTNLGQVTLTQPFAVTASTVTHTSGSIDATGAGVLDIGSTGSFAEGNGNTTGNDVIVQNGSLTWTAASTGHAHFTLWQTATLTGDVPVNSSLLLQGVGCQFDTTVTATGSLTNRGTITLSSAGCGAATTILTGTGTLTNLGTVAVEAGTGGSRYLRTSFTNQGTFTVHAALTYDAAGATFTNQGTVTLTQPMTASANTVRNLTGSIDGSGAGVLTVNGNGTLTGGAGTVTGNAVVAQNASIGFVLPASSGARYTLHQTATITGDIPVGTDILIEGLGCQYDTTVTATGSFTNAGNITVSSGGCGAATAVLTAPGTITNAGLLSVQPGTGGARYLRADVINTGTIQVDAPLTYDTAGATLTNRGAVQMTQPITATNDTVRNEAGSIDATSATGLLTVNGGGSFFVGGGTTSGFSAVLQNASLTFINPDAVGGQYVLHQSVTLTGDIPAAAQLRIEGLGCAYDTTVTATGPYTNAGSITLQSGGCGAANTVLTGGAITNTGTLSVQDGTGGARYLRADVDNQGVVEVDQPLTYDGGTTFTNEGTITLTAPVSAPGATFHNESGSISGTGTALLTVSGGSFDEGGGSTSGAPVVVLNSTLSYSTPSAPSSTFTMHQGGTLTGPVPVGSSIDIQGMGCQYDTSVSAPGNLVNDGAITLDSGGCGSANASLNVGGTLTNGGSFSSTPGTGGAHTLTTTDLVDHGALILVPGSPLALHGNLDVAADGTVIVGVSGPGTNGRVDVTGSATWDGGLRTDTSYVPSFGDTFQVATYGSTAGQFSSTGTTGTQYDVTYGPTSLDISVLKASGVTLASGPSGDTVFGQAVTLTASVAVVPPDTGTPTGTVQFRDGTTVLGTATLDGSQQATLVTTALPVGSRSVTAEYLGSATIGHGTSSIVTRVVDKAATTLAVTNAPSASTPGQAVTFTAAVSVTAPGAGHPSGMVTFYDASTVVGSATVDGAGHAVVTTASLHVGSHSVTGVYSGDDSFALSAAPAVTQVVTGVAITTATSVAAPGPLVATQPVRLVATVVAVSEPTAQPQGIVDFTEGTRDLGTADVTSDGTAAVRLPTGFGVGTHTIVASYAGTTTFDPSASTGRDVVVGRAKATLSVTIGLDPQKPGAIRIEVGATPVAPASSVPAGDVLLRDGDEVVAQTSLDGGHAVLGRCLTSACAPPPTTTTTTEPTTTTTGSPTTTTEATTTTAESTTTTTESTGSTTSTEPTGSTTTSPSETTTTQTTTTEGSTTTSTIRGDGHPAGPGAGLALAPVRTAAGGLRLEWAAPASGATPVPAALAPAVLVRPNPGDRAFVVHQLVASYGGDANFDSYDAPAMPVSVDGDQIVIGNPPPPPTTTTTTAPTDTTVVVTTGPSVTTTVPGGSGATTVPVRGAGGGSAGSGSTTGSGGGATGGTGGSGTTGTTDPTGTGGVGGVTTIPVGAPGQQAGGLGPSGIGRGGSGTTRSGVRGGGPVEDRAQSAAARFGRSLLSRSVADPHHVSTDPVTIITNLAIALVLVLLIAFPAHLFNNTLAENYDEVLGWFGPIDRRLHHVRKLRGKVPTPFVLAGMGVGGAFLFALLDPEFGLNRASLALVLGLLAALVFVSTVYDAARARYMRKHFGLVASVRGYPAGMAVAAVLVVFSRIAHFTPGYLFGVFTALGFNQEVDEREDGKGLAVSAWWLLTAAFLSWLLWMPVSAAASQPSPPFVTLFLDATLSTIWIAGVQGVIFGMLPLRFLDGLKVLHWNRIGWGVLYAAGMFAFVHTMLRPGSGIEHKSFLPALLVFLGFTVASVAFWAYFRFRTPEPGESGPPPDTGGPARELVDA